MHGIEPLSRAAEDILFRIDGGPIGLSFWEEWPGWRLIPFLGLAIAKRATHRLIKSGYAYICPNPRTGEIELCISPEGKSWLNQRMRGRPGYVS